MNSKPTKVLIHGYGNPGRLDDGLGPALAAAFEDFNLPNVTVDSNYQLFIEDAAAMKDHDVVIFADADEAGPEPYWMRRISPKAEVSFSSHSVKPEALLAIAEDMLGGKLQCYLLGIRGYDYNEFGEGLSERAQANLEAAVAFVRKMIEDQNFDECAKLYENGPPHQR